MKTWLAFAQRGPAALCDEPGHYRVEAAKLHKPFRQRPVRVQSAYRSLDVHRSQMSDGRRNINPFGLTQLTKGSTQVHLQIALSVLGLHATSAPRRLAIRSSGRLTAKTGVRFPQGARRSWRCRLLARTEGQSAAGVFHAHVRARRRRSAFPQPPGRRAAPSGLEGVDLPGKAQAELLRPLPAGSLNVETAGVGSA